MKCCDICGDKIEKEGNFLLLQTSDGLKERSEKALDYLRGLGHKCESAESFLKKEEEHEKTIKDFTIEICSNCVDLIPKLLQEIKKNILQTVT